MELFIFKEFIFKQLKKGKISKYLCFIIRMYVKSYKAELSEINILTIVTELIYYNLDYCYNKMQ